MKILIIEDELIISQELKISLKDLGYTDVIQAVNYTEAINLMETNNPDLAIIDINLSGHKTGIDVAEQIRIRYHFPFIFITSNIDEAIIVKAIKTRPTAYLTKPITKTALYSSIELALSNFSKEKIVLNDGIFVKNKESFVKILLADILYFKASGNYVDIFEKENTFLIRSNFNDLMAEHLPENFVRIHKSYLINLDKITSFTLDEVTIDKSIKVPIGESYKAHFLKLIKKI